MLRWHKSERRACAVLFLDLQEAFYRVLRPLVLGNVVSDDLIASMMHKLMIKLPPSAMHDLRQRLMEPAMTAQAGLPRMSFSSCPLSIA